ncbi:MAG: transcriptional regulator [Acidilobaceae archaeon]
MKEEKGELPCEHAAKAIFPSIRSLIAKMLVEECNLSKYMASKILGTTPAAITLYIEGKRGDKYIKKISSDEYLTEILRNAAQELLAYYNETGKINYSLYQRTFCTICMMVNELVADQGCPASHYEPPGKIKRTNE